MIIRLFVLSLICCFNSVVSNCPSKFFDCGNDRCIADYWVCDGENDCENWADEQNCGIEVTTPVIKPCPTDHYHCNDTHNTCIPQKWVCDGMKDCESGVDEKNCSKDSVQCPGFLCHNFECIPKRWKCDGIPDCEDFSDEQNCTQPKTKICDKEHGFYQCMTGECISHFKVCDNHKDCPHGDDEGIECKSDGCHSMNCSQSCFVSHEGPQCYCRDGFVLSHKDNTTCIDRDECHDNRNQGYCSQKCINLEGSYKCQCFDDYHLVNNKSCLVKEGEPLLLFSNSEGIRGFWLKRKEFFPVYHSLRQTVGLDFMGSEQRVYWVDLDKTHSGVYSVGLTGEDFKPVVTNGFKSPEDIAIDWIGENFYVTDPDLNRIVVCRLTGEMCSSTLFGEVDQPRAIVVDPVSGFAYWTEWGKNAGIYRAGMDGSDKALFVKDVIWPNGLSLDSVAKRLYWTEAKDGKIEFLDLITNKKYTILLENVFHPFSLDVFEESMYWSDWTTYSLEVSHKFSAHNRTTLVREMGESIMGVHVFHPLKQQSSYNPCWFHTCSHICVLAPKHKFTCVCPDHLILDKDNQTCIGKPNSPFLLVGASEQIQVLYPEAIGNDVMIEVNLPKGLHIGDIAYNWNSKTVYMFDTNKLSIGFVQLNDSINRYWNPIITSQLEKVEGLTYDYHTNQLYWLETSKGILEVSTTDGKSRALLLHNLDRPIDLALFPERHRMYLAVMGDNPHIIEADMDGQNRKSLVSSKNGFAVSLAVDTIHNKLFWADAKNGIIEWVDLFVAKSKSRKGVVKRNLGNVMSIAVHNKTLFWTDMDSDILHHETYGSTSPPRHSKVTINVRHQGKFEKKLVMAFPHNVSHGPCALDKGGCSHICLIGMFGATCMCPFGYQLQSNGHNCEKQMELTDNSIVCADCVTSDHKSQDLGFIAFERSQEEDLLWDITDEDEEADMLFSRYDSKHKINESHYENPTNGSSTKLTTIQTETTTRPSTPMPTKSSKRQKTGQKTKEIIGKTEDLTDKIKDSILGTKETKLGTESSISFSETEPNNNRKEWLTLFIAVLIVAIIVLLITIIIRRDDYREVRNVIYSRGDQLKGAIVRFQNPLYRRNKQNYDEEEPLNCDTKSLNEEKY